MCLAVLHYNHMHESSLVIGNWKMNPATEAAATALAKALRAATKRLVANTTIVLAPTSLHLPVVRRALGNRSPLKLALQNALPGPVGAHTGEVSVHQGKDMGVSYVIVGHSEQRKRGTPDSEMAATVAMSLKVGLTPVICIGETLRDQQATFYRQVATQLRVVLEGVPTSRYKDIVIAYEPVWAIGTGLTPTPQDVHEMVLFIEKTLTDLAGRAAAKKIRVLYGGSVTKDTAKSLFLEGHVQGFLVG